MMTRVEIEGGGCVELEMEVVDCGYRRRLMVDGARSEKSLARTLFLVFGGKTIGRSPLVGCTQVNL